MTEPTSASEASDRAAVAVAASRAARAKPAKPARGGRFLAAGAAVGLSLAAVGVMSAAAELGEPPPTPVATVQRVVVPQAASPQQIVIVLPGADGASASPISATPPAVAITAPAKPTPPVVIEQAPSPITESEAS